MRLGCFLLVVVFTLAACCQGLVSADATLITNPSTDANREVASGAIVRRHLKGSKLTTEPTSPEDEERGVTSIKEFLGKIPDKFKALVRTNPSQAKALAAKSPTLKSRVGNSLKFSIDEIKDFMNKERHPAVSVLINLLKMIAVVGTISVTAGYLVYTFGKN